jgi:molybdopterin-guanine dinucleotide biosynthesis protein A
VVVLNDAGEWAELQARVVPDAFPESGPLAGIYSGLLAARHEYALAVAADMPFLSPALLGAMLARERDYDALVPRTLRPGAARNQLDVEPLHAIYRKTCLDAMRAALESGRRQIAAFFPHVRVAYVEPEEVLRSDPTGRALENINTPEQLAAAEQLLKA